MSRINKTYAVCIFRAPYNSVEVGILREGNPGNPETPFVVGRLTERGITSIEQLAQMNSKDLLSLLDQLSTSKLPLFKNPSWDMGVYSPIGLKQPVWAAGVTYQNSVLAREEESGRDIYARVYHSQRPEEFPKALSGEDVVNPSSYIGIRRDSDWNVPEPELTIVFNSGGGIVGYTIGNDMSSRSIEGENPLYLPQAKIYKNSFAAGPVLVVGPEEEEVKTWKVNLKIYRGEVEIFNGESTVGNMNRTFKELRDCLFKHSAGFPNGVALSTGTDLVPGTKENPFTLLPNDLVEISISGIGTLKNRVEMIYPRVNLEKI